MVGRVFEGRDMSQLFTDEILDSHFKIIGYRDLIIHISGDEETAIYYLEELKNFFRGKEIDATNFRVFDAFVGYSIMYIAQEIRIATLKRKAKEYSYLNKSKKEQAEWIRNKAKDFKDFLEAIGMDMFVFDEDFDTIEINRFLEFMIKKPEHFIESKKRYLTKSYLSRFFYHLTPPPLKKEVDFFISNTLDSIINKKHNFGDIFFELRSTLDNHRTTPII